MTDSKYERLPHAGDFERVAGTEIVYLSPLPIPTGMPAYRSRTVMLMVFQFFQTIGFYGFSSWVPTLIAQQTGINVERSLHYAFIIAIAAPFAIRPPRAAPPGILSRP